MPTARKDAVSVDAIREVARIRAEETSMRGVASELGLSVSSFHDFLSGAQPRARTFKRMLAWYVEQAIGGSADISNTAIEAALTLLLLHVPPSKRTDAGKEVRRFLAEQAKRNGWSKPKSL